MMKFVNVRDEALPAAWGERLASWTNQLGRPINPALAEEGEAWWLAVDAADQPQACLRWRPALGLKVPRPHFHVGRVVHASPELGLFQTLSTLQLGHDLTGNAELADLALAPEADVQVLAGLIEQALQEAQHRVIVELQGERDAQGASPFWRGLGGHFYTGQPDEAWQRLGEAWLAQLAGLLPRQMIYVSFLAPEARQALGKPGPAALRAREALKQVGWAVDDHVRLDDGGPVWMWHAR